LANVSIEKADPLDPSSAIIGHIRIRAKSQGMALSLGDKVNINTKKQIYELTEKRELYYFESFRLITPKRNGSQRRESKL
jgi:hypothetical protein